MDSKLSKYFGMSGHNCKAVAEKLEILLDGELGQAEEERLIAEIKSCPACLEHYEIDEAFKKLVCEKLQRKCCTEKLKAEILDKINEE